MYRNTRSIPATIGFAWIAMLVSYLPFSAVNGALAAIGADTRADTASLQWVTDAFTVALAVAVLGGGRLGDRFGLRRTAVIGLALTVLCSTVGLATGALAATSAARSAVIPLLWGGQAIGGLGAGLVMSTTLPLIAVTSPTAAVRDRSIAVWAAANVIGLGAGPFLTGAATAVAGWPALFVATGVLALAALFFGNTKARDVRPAGRPPLDARGLATGAAGTVLLVFGVIRAGADGWTDAVALGCLAGAVALLAAFVALELRSSRPIVDPRLFRSGAFSAAGVAAAIALFTMVGLVFVLSIALGRAGVDAAGIALRLGCLFAGNIAASVIAGRLLAGIPAPVILIGGLVTAAAGALSLLSLTELSSAPQLGWRLAVIGAGCGFTVATSAAMAVRIVPPQRSGVAGAANNALRQVGGALGTAVVGAVFAASVGASGRGGLAAGLHAAVLLLATTALITAAVCALLAATTGRRN